MKILFSPEELEAMKERKEGKILDTLMINIDSKQTKKFTVKITNKDELYSHNYHIIVIPSNVIAVPEAEVIIKEVEE